MTIELLGQEPQDDDAICAARYRWVREQFRWDNEGGHGFWTASFPSDAFGLQSSDLDAAIDQVMKESQ